jgi:hypothetical protein
MFPFRIILLSLGNFFKKRFAIHCNTWYDMANLGNVGGPKGMLIVLTM